MNIRRVTFSDQKKWDKFVSESADAAPYHLFGWLVAVQNVYKFRNISLLAEEGGKITGIFPLALFKIPFSRPNVVSLPFCDVGALLTTNAKTEAGLLDAALQLAVQHKASIVDLRGDLGRETLMNCGFPVHTTHNKVRMLLKLPSSSEELWNAFKAKLRSQVRKAEKNQLRFEIANHKVDEFYSIFSENMRDLGSPVHAKKWVEEVIKQFEDRAHLGLVYFEGKAIGAGLILQVGNTVSIPWASTLREYNRLNPNMLLYWGFLQRSADSGCGVFDFGRSTPGEGTYRFKAQWGATPKELPWHRIYLEGQPITDIVGVSANRQRVAAVWKKLPLGIANYVGPQIRKYISL
jgi:FemAB-related protein (PEP-CTERM system-associated)